MPLTTTFHWTFGKPFGLPLQDVLSRDVAAECRQLLAHYRERKQAGYYEPLRPETQQQFNRRLRDTMYQVETFLMTGKVPAFVAAAHGAAAQPPHGCSDAPTAHASMVPEPTSQGDTFP